MKQYKVTIELDEFQLDVLDQIRSMTKGLPSRRSVVCGVVARGLTPDRVSPVTLNGVPLVTKDGPLVAGDVEAGTVVTVEVPKPTTKPSAQQLAASIPGVKTAAETLRPRDAAPIGSLLKK